MNGIHRLFFPLYVLGMYLFMYAPIVVLVLFSWNSNPFGYVWGGFTTAWYQELFASSAVIHALKNSFIVAFSSAFLSCLMGSLFIFFLPRAFIDRATSFFYGGLIASEIVLAVGMLSFFSFLSVPLGLTTLIAGHTVLGLGYVAPIMYARYQELDKSMIEASTDLGASHMQTFYTIILPLLSPAIVASSLLVFIISFDDFIIAFFCAGAADQTIPMYIFSLLRSGATPLVNALSTVLLLLSSILVLLFSSLHIKKMETL
ncbi:MAG TPA: ABC transporter permease [Candidatus Bathyarchaeia archaeon]|nr:ABC transporter permease [Candidatus Bathyarchaeia archaeon]